MAKQRQSESPEWRRLQSELRDMLAARLDSEAEPLESEHEEPDTSGGTADRSSRAEPESGAIQRGRGYVRLRRERSVDPTADGGLLFLKHRARVRREQGGAFARPIDDAHGRNGGSGDDSAGPDEHEDSAG